MEPIDAQILPPESLAGTGQPDAGNKQMELVDLPRRHAFRFSTIRGQLRAAIEAGVSKRDCGRLRQLLAA